MNPDDPIKDGDEVAPNVRVPEQVNNELIVIIPAATAALSKTSPAVFIVVAASKVNVDPVVTTVPVMYVNVPVA